MRCYLKRISEKKTKMSKTCIKESIIVAWGTTIPLLHTIITYHYCKPLHNIRVTYGASRLLLYFEHEIEMV